MSKETPAVVANINIVVRPDLPGTGARILSRQNASELPSEVRDGVTFPCVVTGDLGVSQSTLTLLVAQALSEYLDARGTLPGGVTSHVSLRP